MARPNHTPRLAETEEAVIVFFLMDDAHRILNPRGDRYETFKRLSDSEVVTLALLSNCGHGEPALFPARRRAVLLAPFPGVIGPRPPHCIAGCASPGASGSPCGGRWRG
jgi:hypothetical protein